MLKPFCFWVIQEKKKIFSLEIGVWEVFYGTNPALKKPPIYKTLQVTLLWTSFVGQKTEVSPSAFSHSEIILGIFM